MEEVIIIGMKQQFFKIGSLTVKDAKADGSGGLWLGRMASGIANLSFACELSLKHLYYQKNSKAIFGHKLLDLYKNLEEKIQLEIKSTYIVLCKSKLKFLDKKPSYYRGEVPKNYIQNPYNFDEEIEKYSLSFIDYRYYFEPEKTKVLAQDDNETVYYCFDYRFLYLFFLAINKCISDNTYNKHLDYYENLKSNIMN